MKISRLHFSVDIKAEKTRIWEALWEDSAYRDWTSLFSEGSHAITENWKEGSKVHFLGPDKSGIYSIIETHIPNKKMAFRHIGKVQNGKEQALDEETKQWSGTLEVYTLNEGTNSITLKVEIDVLEEHLEFMKDIFPKALQRIKSNCR